MHLKKTPIDRKQKNNISSFTTDIRSVLRSAHWAFKHTWVIHKPFLAGLFAVTLIQSVAPAGLVLVARGVVNAVASGLSKGEPSTNILMLWLGVGLLVSMAEAVSRSAGKYFSRRLHDELNLKTTTNMLEHAANLEVQLFEDPHFQDVLQRARDKTADNLSQFITSVLSILTSVIQVVSMLLILLVVEPLISGVLMLLGLPYFLFQWHQAKVNYERQNSRATKHRWTRYFVSLLTSQRSVSEIKLLDIGPFLINKYRALLEEFKAQDSSFYLRGFMGSMIFYLISTTAFYSTFAWIAFLAVNGQLTLGDVAMYGGITSRLSWIIENVVISAAQTLEKALFISNLIAFFSVRPVAAGSSKSVPDVKNKPIEFRNVSFTYPGTQKPVISDISMRINPGETIALVGENGVGKTTLAKLVARLYEPDSGGIFIDGMDIRNIPIDRYYKEISFVFQEFGRYEATVSDNIAYGNWWEMMGAQKKIEEIAWQSGVHDMIMKMPDGYNTLLGRLFGLHTLSGGQWQQIAIARAFARNASILILDEPSSNLDSKTEYKLFSRFKALSADRTTILISHRFSTVSIADRIVVLDKGRIIEQGTHHELIKKKGHYASLYDLHQSKML